MEPKNVRITLECTECKQRNYDTTKNKKNVNPNSPNAYPYRKRTPWVGL